LVIVWSIAWVMARCNSLGLACSGRRKANNKRLRCCAKRSRRASIILIAGDFYGPHVTNVLIREALHIYRDDLVIVTKVGAVRGKGASWNPAMTPEELTRAVHHNLRNLNLERLDVVNLHWMADERQPAEGSIAPQLEVLADLKRRGLIRHLGSAT
jgi:aryl-alcohol dehydrogenase-like predicted oxidoreductase